MHGFEIKTDDGDRIIINHNSDWSGLAYLKWWRGGVQQAEVALPGSALCALALELAGKVVRDKLIAVLEDLPVWRDLPGVSRVAAEAERRATAIFNGAAAELGTAGVPVTGSLVEVARRDAEDEP